MKFIQKIFLFCFSSVLFASCLKKDTTFYDASQSPAVISFGNTGNPTYNLYPYYLMDLGVVGSGDTSGFNVNIQYGGPSNAPQDITVSLAVDTTALRLYNNAQGTNYVLAPMDVFKIPSTVTIKAGTKMGTGRPVITVAPDYNYNASYVLPLKIASVSPNTTISGNLGTVIYQYGVRNKYDGVYSYKGYVLRQGDDVLGGFFNGYTQTLFTKGANAVLFNQTWRTNAVAAGLNPVTFSVDQSTNKVTVSSASNPAVVNLPGYDNRYDPTTKTFYVSFYWGTGPTNRAATDTLTFLHLQ